MRPGGAHHSSWHCRSPSTPPDPPWCDQTAYVQSWPFRRAGRAAEPQRRIAGPSHPTSLQASSASSPMRTPLAATSLWWTTTAGWARMGGGGPGARWRRRTHAGRRESTEWGAAGCEPPNFQSLLPACACREPNRPARALGLALTLQCRRTHRRRATCRSWRSSSPPTFQTLWWRQWRLGTPAWSTTISCAPPGSRLRRQQLRQKLQQRWRQRRRQQGMQRRHETRR